MLTWNIKFNVHSDWPTKYLLLVSRTTRIIAARLGIADPHIWNVHRLHCLSKVVACDRDPDSPLIMSCAWFKKCSVSHNNVRAQKEQVVSGLMTCAPLKIHGMIEGICVIGDSGCNCRSFHVSHQPCVLSAAIPTCVTCVSVT